MARHGRPTPTAQVHQIPTEVYAHLVHLGTEERAGARASLRAGRARRLQGQPRNSAHATCARSRPFNLICLTMLWHSKSIAERTAATGGNATNMRCRYLRTCAQTIILPAIKKKHYYMATRGHERELLNETHENIARMTENEIEMSRVPFKKYTNIP